MRGPRKANKRGKRVILWVKPMPGHSYNREMFHLECSIQVDMLNSASYFDIFVNKRLRYLVYFGELGCLESVNVTTVRAPKWVNTNQTNTSKKNSNSKPTNCVGEIL